MYVTINEDKCIGCNACIRVCPVHDANVAKLSEDGRHSVITINTSECIGCGECVKSCRHKARTYTDDTESFFADIGRGKDITVIVAPAFRLIETDAGAMLAHLRKLGVKLIYDVAFGADICTYMHIRMLKEGKAKKIISQPCAALVEYVLKHKHELIKSLSPVHSPISCTAVYLRKYRNISGPIACISPCIAKKCEFDETGLVQYNVTFSRFVEYMKNNFRYDRSADFEFDNISAYCGKIYPRPGGLKDCLMHAVPELNVISCEGVSRIYPGLEYYSATPQEDLPDVLDLLSCESGCFSGPGANFDFRKSFSYMSRANKAEYDAFTGREKNAVRYSVKKDKQFKWFEKNLRYEDFIRQYTPKEIEIKSVSESDINAAYAALLKTTAEEKHFDCHACGYRSCRNMAAAVATGVNVPENCHQYILKQSDIAHINAISAHESVREQNERIVNAVVDITKDIEKICGDTDTISANCVRNNSEMSGVNEMLGILSSKCAEISSAVSAIADVNERYREMSEAILSITDQTHILSINASVEAAKAGDAGRSFAVVAQEIRSLASSTKETTDAVDENDKLVKKETERVLRTAKEIADVLSTLESAVSRVNSNVVLTSETGEYIKNMAENIRNTVGTLRD